MSNSLVNLIPEKLRKKHTIAESKLLSAVQNGERLNLYADDEPIDLANASKWGPEHIIRAEFLHWLCTDSTCANLIHSRGIQIVGAKIDGELDLEGANIPHLLVFEHCSFKDKIILRNARTRAISLDGTHTKAILADRLRIEGDFSLASRFKASGEVRLYSAKVGGNFNCSNGFFLNEEGIALYANNIEVRGDVHLNAGFSANGGVGFNCAVISGSLYCAGLFIKAYNQYALDLNGIETKGSVFLNEGFSAIGIVGLVSARIQANLICRGRFINNAGDCFLAQKMNVAGVFSWNLKERPVGNIDLRHAKVGVLSDNYESWPEPGKLEIDGFEYDALAPDKTPTGAERLTWIELQLPPVKKDALLATEPLQNKYPIKWLWIVLRRWLKNFYKGFFTPKPYGNFEEHFHIDYRPQPYEQLAKVLKKEGNEGGSKEVLVAKQEALCNADDLSNRRRLWHRFLGITMGHGFEPLRPILFLLFLSFLGFSIFGYAKKNSMMVMSKLNMFKDHLDLYPEFNPYIYSLDALVPFLDLHQENYWIPSLNPNHPLVSALIDIYLWFHIILGWVGTTFAAVSLSIIVRKKD